MSLIAFALFVPRAKILKDKITPTQEIKAKTLNVIEKTPKAGASTPYPVKKEDMIIKAKIKQGKNAPLELSQNNLKKSEKTPFEAEFESAFANLFLYSICLKFKNVKIKPPKEPIKIGYKIFKS